MADKITDDGLKALLDNEIANALGYVGKLSAQRQKALYYYNGDAKLELAPPEIDGRSSVVSTDVSDVVEWIMPQLVKIFAGSDEAVSFSATNEHGEAAAEQATAYCNYVFYRQNKGFQVLHNWFKDALIEKAGVVKIWWEEKEDVTKERYQGLTTWEIAILLMDESVKIIEQQPSESAPLQLPASQGMSSGMPPQAMPPLGPQGMPPQGPQGMPPMQGGMPPQGPPQAPPQMPMPGQPPPQPTILERFDIVLARTKNSSRVCIENVPPEEFLISRRARTMDDPMFLAHRIRTNPSKLKAQGYKDAVIEKCTGEFGNNNVEAIERRSYDDESPIDRGQAVEDPSLREIWLNECYLNVDYDGDGIAELRKVTKCGTEILDNEEVDDHPFALLTPIMMPHRVIGKSIADIVFDIQRIKTVLWRQYLDSGYLANNPRYYVDTNKNVNLDDLLTVRPGGIVRGNGPDGVLPLTIPHTGQQALEGIQAMDDVRESRTGVSKFKNITNPESLNKSATEVNAASDASNQRIELIARIFAETGVSDLFRKIQKLGSQYAQQSITLRINGKWTPVDPREWKTAFDVSINVGLGSGNKDQAVQHMTMLAGMQQQAMQLGLATPKNIYNTAIEVTKAMGIKDTDKFWTDPSTNPPPPPPVPPEVQVAQIEAQTKVQLAQHQGQADMQTAMQKAQLEEQTKQVQAQATAQSEAARAQADVAIEQHKANVKAQLDQQQTQSQFALDDARHNREQETAIRIAQINAEAKIIAAQVAAQQTPGNAGAAADQDFTKQVAPDLSGPLTAAIQALGAAAGSKKIIRGPDGRAEGTAPA